MDSSVSARKYLLKVVMLALAVAMVVSSAVLVTGCGSESSPDASVESGDATGDAAEEPAEPELDTANLAVGDVVTIEGVGVGVKAIEKGPKDWGGDSTLRVTVVYENGTDGEISFNSFDWSVQDENGVRQDTSLTDEDSLSSGDLAPGGKVEGDVFLPSKGAAKIVYSGNIFFDEEEDKLMWNVK